MNAEISETMGARLLRFGVQIPELLGSASLVRCHAHSSAHKPAQNCGSYSFDARIKILTEMYCSHQYLSIDHAHLNAHKPRKPVTPTILMLDKKF